MNIGIDDLYDDDDVRQNQQEEEQQVATSESSKEPSNEDNDFVSDILKSKGIEDSTKIKFEDENGDIYERDWNSLTREEQLNIINTPIYQENKKPVDNSLTEDEISLINSIRNSNLSVSQYLQQLQPEQQEPVYKIDDLTDDELYILDLESRVGELSDEVAAEALNNAKQNEDLFKKQVEGIRKEYKDREDLESQQQQAVQEQEQQEAYDQFQNTVINSINNFDSIGNLDLNFEDSDREELAEFMLTQDESGNNYLWQALQDPDTLVRAAWFILNGEEAFKNVSDYFINKIKLVSENQYKKGFEEGRKGMQPSRPEVVIDHNKNNNNFRRIYKSIEDLNDED